MRWAALRRPRPPSHWCPRCDGCDLLWQDKDDGGRLWWCADCGHEWGHRDAVPRWNPPVRTKDTAPAQPGDPYS
ncbi:hypothetical protein ACFWUZ_31940 [Streptomyces sp. NPDC058646]|uniref:hypothetical protein n=1 Tax=Streptomyces sp. NPDC058646 TaxID=3346574 RepID=UPI0036592F18